MFVKSQKFKFPGGEKWKISMASYSDLFRIIVYANNPHKKKETLFYLLFEFVNGVGLILYLVPERGELLGVHLTVLVHLVFQRRLLVWLNSENY